MKTFFLSKDYLALSLIKAKKQIFHESFITISELNQYDYFLQQEFNNRNLDIVITSNSLSEDFKIIGGAIITSDTCYLNLYSLPLNVLSILCDDNLTIDFFVQLEKEKLDTLERTKGVVPKLHKN